MSNEGWTVIGGKGKPRRSQPNQQQCAGTSAPQHHQKESLQRLDATSAPVLPGWVQEAAISGNRRQRVGRGLKERTLEQKVADYSVTVIDYKREIASHPIYGSLQCAVATASQQAMAGPAAAPEDEASPTNQCVCLHTVHQMVVYGLGCVEDSRVSRYQLALALLLRDFLPSLRSPAELFDPVFSQVDMHILRKLSLQPIEVNEDASRAVQAPTLFYLPHLEAALCDNLLAANWTPEQLPMLLVLGNSFKTYGERFAMGSASPSIKRPERMLQLLQAGAVLELPVPDHAFHVASAFNDLSLHVFPAERLEAAKAALWPESSAGTRESE